MECSLTKFQEILKKNYRIPDGRLYCLTKPNSISYYLRHVTEEVWHGEFAYNYSNESEAIYSTLKFFLEENKLWCYRLRIANHPCTKDSLAGLDFDIQASFFRPDATSYPKVLSKISQELALPLPSEISYVLQKPNQIHYSKRMHQRAKAITKNPDWHRFHDKIFFK